MKIKSLINFIFNNWFFYLFTWKSSFLPVKAFGAFSRNWLAIHMIQFDSIYELISLNQNILKCWYYVCYTEDLMHFSPLYILNAGLSPNIQQRIDESDLSSPVRPSNVWQVWLCFSIYLQKRITFWMKKFQVWKTILDENEKIAQARLAAIQVTILGESKK